MSSPPGDTSAAHSAPPSPSTSPDAGAGASARRNGIPMARLRGIGRCAAPLHGLLLLLEDLDVQLGDLLQVLFSCDDVANRWCL